VVSRIHSARLAALSSAATAFETMERLHDHPERSTIVV